MYYDLTRGSISKSLFFFALPMMAGNLLQQFYNIADTLIVGRVLGTNALAAVGSAYTLMTFLTSIFLGLSMGGRCAFLNLPWKGREGSSESGSLSCLCADHGSDGCIKRTCISVLRADFDIFVRACGSDRADASVSPDHICGSDRNLGL